MRSKNAYRRDYTQEEFIIRIIELALIVNRRFEGLSSNQNNKICDHLIFTKILTRLEQ